MPDTTIFTKPAGAQKAEHFDVVIVGAGISGVGGAYHLTKQCPGTSFVVLESRESFGGTWIAHRYPGIRSDSDSTRSATASSLDRHADRNCGGDPGLHG